MSTESPSAEDLVSAYNDVFSVRGGAPLSKYGPQVQYVEDLLRRVVPSRPFQPLNLTEIRSIPRNQLMRLLFKAIAGHFISGPSALRGDVCRLVADPATGTLEVTRDGGGSEVALTVIALILLIVLGVTLYKGSRVSKEPA